MNEIDDYAPALLAAKAAVKKLDECLPKMGWLAIGANNGARDLLQAAAYLYSITDKAAKKELAEFMREEMKASKAA